MSAFTAQARNHTPDLPRVLKSATSEREEADIDTLNFTLTGLKWQGLTADSLQIPVWSCRPYQNSPKPAKLPFLLNSKEKTKFFFCFSSSIYYIGLLNLFTQLNPINK
jgi:hypothetical protein